MRLCLFLNYFWGDILYLFLLWLLLRRCFVTVFTLKMCIYFDYEKEWTSVRKKYSLLSVVSIRVKKFRTGSWNVSTEVVVRNVTFSELFGETREEKVLSFSIKEFLRMTYFVSFTVERILKYLEKTKFVKQYLSVLYSFSRTSVWLEVFTAIQLSYILGSTISNIFVFLISIENYKKDVDAELSRTEANSSLDDRTFTLTCESTSVSDQSLYMISSIF